MKVELIKLECTIPHNLDNEQREFQPSGVLVFSHIFHLFKLLGKNKKKKTGLSSTQMSSSCVPRNFPDRPETQNGSLVHRYPEGIFGGGCAA